MYRLDNIKKVSVGKTVADKQQIVEDGEKFLKHEWYVSSGNDNNLEHLEMILQIDPWAEHILKRLNERAVKALSKGRGRIHTDFQLMFMMHRR